MVIISAAIGAIVGDNLGYWIGREGGSKLIKKYGKFVGLSEDRYVKVQEFLKSHGGKAVFFGRFFLKGTSRFKIIKKLLL